MQSTGFGALRIKRDASVQAGDSTVQGIAQPTRVAGLAYGPAVELQWSQSDKASDFFDLKGDIEALLAPRAARFVRAEHPAMHPGRCAAVELDGTVIGHIGELHPKWRQAYELQHAPMLFELDLEAVQRRGVPVAKPVPRQQAVSRDLALVVSEQVSHDALIATLRADAAGLVREATLFDMFKPATPTADIPAGHRSLAIRLELLDDDATLTDERIASCTAEAVGRAQAAHGARLRA